MKSSIFYVVVAIFATAQAVIIRSPRPDEDPEDPEDPEGPECRPTDSVCKWPLSVSASQYDGAYGLYILLLGYIDPTGMPEVRPSIPLNRSLIHILTISFFFSFFFSWPLRAGM